LFFSSKASGRPAWGFFIGRRKMIFYCPHCWKELPDGEAFCPYCRKKISSWDVKTFTDKLLGALCHPEPTTQTRAVYILGERKSEEALGPLARLFRQSKNPFLKSEIVAAAGKIGGSEALAFVVQALRQDSFMVRSEAAHALGGFVGHHTAKRALAAALEDPSPYVRESARKAWERLQCAATASPSRR
jgi:HEAT repeat protein